MWIREPGFATLMLLILEQQVSLSSARATYSRLLDAVSPLTPRGFLKLGDACLRSIGFSRQKTSYGRNLARAVVEKSLNVGELESMDDPDARSELMKIKGIGPWTADVYLLTALRRPDIWPRGDLALVVAAQKIKGLATRPSPGEFEAIGFPWKPWRAVAARLLWHYYLNRVVGKKLPEASPV